MNEEEMLRRFRTARVARLATLDDRLRPHLVPLVFAIDGHRLFSAVDAKPKRTQELKRLRNIASHPAVSLLVDHYEDDWRKLWWVRADGKARIATDDSDRLHGLELLSEKYPQYEEEPPPGPLIIVDIEALTGWSAEAG